MIERGGVTLLLAVRLIPIVPFSLVCYAAGAARVPLWRFVWTTAVGYLPITALAVYFGTRLEGLSLTDPLVLGSAAALLGLLLGRPLDRARAGRRPRRRQRLSRPGATRKRKTAGVGSTLPAASRALTRTRVTPDVEAPRETVRAEAGRGRGRSGRRSARRRSSEPKRKTTSPAAAAVRGSRAGAEEGPRRDVSTVKRRLRCPPAASRCR